MNAAIAEAIRTECQKHGWTPVPPRQGSLVFARRPVQTFRGEAFATINLPITWEHGGYCLSALFESEGKNALCSCHAYFQTVEELPVKFAQFNQDVSKALAAAYSVRIA